MSPLHSPAKGFDVDDVVYKSRTFHLVMILVSACLVLVGALLLTAWQAHQEGVFECPEGRQARGAKPPIDTTEWCVLVVDGQEVSDGPFVRWHKNAYRYGKSGRLPLPVQTGGYKMGKKHGAFMTYEPGLKKGPARLEEHYAEGRLHGKRIRRSASGRVIEMRTFEHGRYVDFTRSP